MRRTFVVFVLAFVAFAGLWFIKSAIAGEPGLEPEREPTAVAETKSNRYLSWTGNWRFRWNWMADLDLDNTDYNQISRGSGSDPDTFQNCVGGISDQEYCYKTDARVFATHRLRVDPVIHVTDDIAIYTQFDVFANGFDTVGSGFESNIGSVFGGNTGRDFTRFGAPLIRSGLTSGIYQNLVSPRHLFGSTDNDPDAESITTGNFEGSNADFSNMPKDYVDDFYDGEYSQTTTSDGDDNFRFRRVWMEWNTPYGILKVGRMPRDWGLGIRLNSGSNVWDHFGDTFDSALFEAAMGNLKAGGFADQIEEGDIDINIDDTNNYGAYLQYTDPEMELDAGLMYTFFKSSETNIAVSILDGFAKKQFGDFYVGWEGVFAFGNIGNAHLGCDTGQDFSPWGNAGDGTGSSPYPPLLTCRSNNNNSYVSFAGGPTNVGNWTNANFNDFEIAQIGSALETAWNFDENLTLYFNTGYASGQDFGHRGRYEHFAFDRNYDVGLILFNHGVGKFDADLGMLNWRSVPYSSAVNNAFYLQGGASYDWTDELNTAFNVVWARAPHEQLAGQNKNYGLELDFIFGYEFSKNLHAGLDWGILFAGNFWRGGNAAALVPVDGANSTWNGTPTTGYVGTSIMGTSQWVTGNTRDVAWLLGANMAVTF